MVPQTGVVGGGGQGGRRVLNAKFLVCDHMIWYDKAAMLRVNTVEFFSKN